jgi:hypothetical protein
MLPTGCLNWSIIYFHKRVASACVYFRGEADTTNTWNCILSICSIVPNQEEKRWLKFAKQICLKFMQTQAWPLIRGMGNGVGYRVKQGHLYTFTTRNGWRTTEWTQAGRGERSQKSNMFLYVSSSLTRNRNIQEDQHKGIRLRIERAKTDTMLCERWQHLQPI